MRWLEQGMHAQLPAVTKWDASSWEAPPPAATPWPNRLPACLLQVPGAVCGFPENPSPASQA